MHFLNEHAITHALLTPAALAVLPFAELPDLQVLITGGEACSNQVVDRWAASRHFFNAYGPTENTIWATVAELHPGDDPSTIGHPIPNTQTYILDGSMNPVPIGIPGELYIGGAGIACGYLNRPELTAERFIPNPFRESMELRMENEELRMRSKEAPSISNSQFPLLNFSLLYKTGDRAQYLADGTIQFLGRADDQIKIRGFRVELGEIEAILHRHSAIQDAVVIASEEITSEKRLITYFSINPHYLQQTIRNSLQNQQIQFWQTLYNQTYQSPNSPQSSVLSPQPSTLSTQHFNTTGWNSSYTGNPFRTNICRNG